MFEFIARICSLKYVFHFASMARILLANRGERSIETIASSDQWFITIENHWTKLQNDPKTTKNPWKKWSGSCKPFNADGCIAKNDFLEKFKGKEGWEGVIFNPRMYVANFGPLNRAYWAWNWKIAIWKIPIYCSCSCKNFLYHYWPNPKIIEKPSSLMVGQSK